MARSNPEYQKLYYQRNRDKRLAQAKDYAKSRKEYRKAYMRDYAIANPEKFKKSPEQQVKHNADRRNRYASDERHRSKIKADVKRHREARPETGWAHNLRQYGLSLEGYQELLKAQEGCCAICKNGSTGDNRNKRYNVDHCHGTGAVRGLLCSSCNLGLGKFGDRSDLLEAAAMYLRTSIGRSTADK